jgi:hypothetical protein
LERKDKKATETIKRYFMILNTSPNDIKRSAERVSGANLDWYLVDWNVEHD